MGNQRGFSLIETMVAAAVLVILMGAGGWWLLSFHPGALRSAADSFDSTLTAGRALAAASGNGATIIFVPRTDSTGRPVPGFTMKLYRGRPTAAGAVTDANLGSLTSDASIVERTLGAPPFVIFLSSSGMPSGTGSYPSTDAHGAVSFPVLAKQPPCPSGGIVLTFRSPQGASDTRSLACDAVASGVTSPNASPTPNLPAIAPTTLVSHWVTGAPSLRFIAAEFGYTHWFGSIDSGCAGIAPFATGWPYTQPQNASESALGPAPPNTPYSWPNNNGGSMNDAPAPFVLQPLAAGVCSTAVADDFGQQAAERVQVMSDLYIVSMPPNGDATQNPAQLSFYSPNDPAVTIVVGKTYDSDPVHLLTGGSCGTLPGNAFLTMSDQTLNTQSSPGSTPSTSTFSIAPNGQTGSCDLTLIDPYAGSPNVHIHVVVNAAMSVEPKAVEYPAPPAKYIPYPSGVPVAYDNGVSGARLASILNALLGGANAFAGTGTASGTPCSALAFTDNTFSTLDGADDTDIGTQGGCWVSDTNGKLVNPLPGLSGVNATSGVLEKGYRGEAFSIFFGSCSSTLYPGPFSNGDVGPRALQTVNVSSSARPIGCTFSVADQNQKLPSKVVDVRVINSQCAIVCYAVVSNELAHTLLPPCSPLEKAAGDCPPPEYWSVITSDWYESQNAESSWNAIGSSTCGSGLSPTPTNKCDSAPTIVKGTIPTVGPNETLYRYIQGVGWLAPPGAPFPQAPPTVVKVVPVPSPTP